MNLSKFSKLLFSDIPLPVRKIPVRELGVFCRQFSVLAGIGLPILTALSLLEEQTGNKQLKTAVREVAESVEKGTSLTESMKKKPKIFSTLFISLVKAGEESGQLPVAMERMAVHYEKTARLKSTVQKAMIYPVILSCACLALILLLLLFLLPLYTQIFAEMSAELPAVTRGVLRLSELLQNWWNELMGAAFVFGGFIYFWTRTEMGSMIFERFCLRVPCFGRLSRMNACALFAGTMELLTEAGIMLPEALELTAGVMKSPLWRREAERMRRELLQGVLLAETIKRSGLFPPVLCHMAGIGEETGSLPEMLAGAARYYEEEASARAEKAAAALEPFTILLMSGIVAVVIAAVFSPVMALYESLEYL